MKIDPNGRCHDQRGGRVHQLFAAENRCWLGTSVDPHGSRDRLSDWRKPFGCFTIGQTTRARNK
jgi:hypothetical protein